MKLSGVDPPLIESKNVEVSPGIFMRTYCVGDISKPKAVFIHGFGGTGLTYYKLYKKLSQHYYVMFIDQIGIASSSKPDFDCQTPEQCNKYMVDYFELWRKAMDITGFYLIAHSWGGYLAGLYAVSYSQHIKKIIFVSPVGF
mmetsp:Transcript_7988/g.5674  ORF Transcript_7988/g.5674 Transcript_7988/m.5674 type:complete len:142 (+) Transcript_7988:55-480(+)